MQTQEKAHWFKYQSISHQWYIVQDEAKGVGPFRQVLADLPRNQLSLCDQLAGIEPSLQGGAPNELRWVDEVWERKQNGTHIFHFAEIPTTTLLRTSVVIEGNTLSS